MGIKEIGSQEVWNNFLLSQPTQAGIFLQSWEWLEFQKALGRKVWRLGVMEHETWSMEQLVGVCGLAKYDLPMGKSYLYALRGPVLNEKCKMQNYELLFEKLKYIAEKEQSIFFRIEPTEKLQEVTQYQNKFGAGQARGYRRLQEVKPIQPKQTLICDLAPSEDDLLAGMHEKTRYNIRLALRKNVKCQMSNVKCFPEFWKMFQETAKRDGFKTHERKYYETMLRVFSHGTWNMEHGTMGVKLHMAYAGDAPIAGAIVEYFGDTATYLFGASSYEHRSYMGPYGLHWTIMKEAKKMGYRFYDFWGTDTQGAAQTHGRDWSGITRFKMGFNGKLMEYSGTFDLPMDRFWYTVYQLGRRVL